ncbi:hypothetical protein V6N13_105764 [Hibiscus sabdariffa]
MALLGGNTGGNLQKLYYRLVASKLRSVTSKSGIPKIAQYDLIKEISTPRQNRICCSPLIKLIDTNEVVSKHRFITWVDADSVYEGTHLHWFGKGTCGFFKV